MAPTKNTRATSKQLLCTNNTTTLKPVACKGPTRRTGQNVQTENVDIMQTRGKRKAEQSPAKYEKVKRSALGNLTNNNANQNVKLMTTCPDDDVKQPQQSTKKKEPINLDDSQQISTEQQQTGVLTRASSRILNNINNNNVTSKVLDEGLPKKLPSTVTGISLKNKTNDEPAPASISQNIPHPPKATCNKPVRRISNEFNKTEESLYMSALEDVSSDSLRLSGNFEAARRRSQMLQKQLKTEFLSPALPEETETAEVQPKMPPVGVEDFDKANWNDPFQVSHYAMDIFNYLKAREAEFPIDDYMKRQVHLSKWMRALLVDWMVEVQETFELNHETLYLAVKVVDLFLCKVVINKDKLQLLGASALFIACKFDERTPPLIEDFLYICDGAYKHEELIHMEMCTLRTIDYDLGIPLSYRFLRRYARCAKIAMPTLTLARYILELSLMDYDTIAFSDSKMAAAALFIALRLVGEEEAWNATLEYYSGYKLMDFGEIVPVLNEGLHRKPKGTIKTIRSKYSHKIFHEVAKVALMTTEELFENNLDLASYSMSAPINTLKKAEGGGDAS
ncbi:G2/mitotic-specific cyclin-B3-like [Glossina fuscipes fuscipes]